MRQFFKFAFASCLGVFLSMACIVLIFIIIGSFSGDDSVKVSQNTVLELKFDKLIPEKTNNTPFKFQGFSKLDNETLGLLDIQKAIRHAKDDKKIKGIILDITTFSGGFSKASVIRKELEEFAKSGKFIMSYGDHYSQGSYYLSTVSTNMFLHPLGMIDFKGLGAMIPFFKDMLDKIGVKAQVFYAGKFKSATEPFRLSHMSEENRYQVREYLHDLNEVLIKDIARSRKLSESDVVSIMNNYDGHDADLAKSKNMIDNIGYYTDMLDAVKSKMGLKAADKLNKISLNDYVSSYNSNDDFSSKDKIAIVYAEGDIIDGKSENGQIGSEKYITMLRKIAADKNVRALVLRVNSPGGSALASESILHELKMIKQQGIPIVVSMSDYAASGGYYISCAADSIFAEQNTITGSIGVFSIFPNVEELMNKKLGINFDTVNTGHYSTAFSPFYPVNGDQAVLMQNITNKMYSIFVDRVAKARKMTPAQVNEIAQGRVWTGEDAIKVGLVDKLGGLEDALASAAKLAKLKKYRKSEYPKIKDPIQQIIDEIKGNKEDQEVSLLKSQLGEYYTYYDQLKKINSMRGIQMRMPYDLIIK